MKQILVVSFLLLGLSASGGWATKYAGEFLALGVGARALGMGGAFVSLADDATAAYWNPAGIVLATGRELGYREDRREGPRAAAAAQLGIAREELRKVKDRDAVEDLIAERKG